MGRKVHPVGFRLAVSHGWQGRWFAEGAQYREQLKQDFAIRKLVQQISPKAGVSRVEVERYPGKVKVTVSTAKPGKSRIVAMSFCEPRSWTRVLSS